MKRRISSSSATAAAEPKPHQAGRLKSLTPMPFGQRGQTQAAAFAASSKTAAAKQASAEFSVRIVHAQEAKPFLEAQDSALLKPDSLAFLLCERAPENTPETAHYAASAAHHTDSQDESAVLGYCLIRRKAEPARSRAVSDAAEPPAAAALPAAPASYNHSGSFLEIAAFRLYAALDEAKAAARAKTLLLRAVADYCRRQEVEYVCGQFSFAGKYPAAYAREFSCLYHYYRMKGALPQIRMSGADAERAPAVSMDIMPAEAVPPDKSRRFLPPMLRYCLKLGAKVSDSVTIDRSYNHGIGAMNVFLTMPARPILKTPLHPANIPKTG